METILSCQELVLSQIPAFWLPHFVIIPKQGHGLLEEHVQPRWEVPGNGRGREEGEKKERSSHASRKAFSSNF